MKCCFEYSFLLSADEVPTQASRPVDSGGKKRKADQGGEEDESDDNEIARNGTTEHGEVFAFVLCLR